MLDFFRNRIPIRVRLTLWYVLLLGFTFTAFSLLLLARFQVSLRDTIDQSLQLAVNQTLAGFDPEEFREEGRVTLEKAGGSQFVSPGFSMRIVSAQSLLWDSFGTVRAAWGDLQSGYSTQAGADGISWRIFSAPILNANKDTLGWVQASQSMQVINQPLEELRQQVLWMVPLVLLLAGLGGYFLANRSLRPIQRITDAAREISASDLSRRINHQGAQDEVGHLAEMFDQMLARLQRAFEVERQFTSDAAHELRTPLAALKGQIEVSLNQPRQAREYETKLLALAYQVDRLIRLSNALLFLSLSDQKQLPWDPRQVNLAEVLEVILEQIRPLAAESRLSLEAEIPAGLPVFGDRDHLTRIFMNLLENAVKYTPATGQIRLRACHEQEGVKVAIHNSGPGIPAQHLPHVFDRFYRVDADRSSVSGGIGLGLAIARQLVQKHGGTIGVESENPGGVTFSVWLPSSSQSA